MARELPKALSRSRAPASASSLSEKQRRLPGTTPPTLSRRAIPTPGAGLGRALCCSLVERFFEDFRGVLGRIRERKPAVRDLCRHRDVLGPERGDVDRKVFSEHRVEQLQTFVEREDLAVVGDALARKHETN